MFRLFLLSAFLFQISNAFGSIELVVTAQQDADISTQICTNIRCNQHDDNIRKFQLNANIPFRKTYGYYKEQLKRYYDLHLIIFNTNGDLIGNTFTKQESDKNWRTNIIETSDGFNVSYSFRTICDNNYFGSQCQFFCKDSPDSHIECSSSGQKKCMKGWTGEDCMTPICEKNCSGNGKCVSAGQCECNNGFEGSDCSECVAKPGCIHGGCANNQSFTCQCFAGYNGPLCDKHESNRCQLCQNGAICLNENRCECPAGFIGEFCEVPLDSVKCKNVRGRQSCLNGGTCISFDDKVMECKCKPGFSGQFCEIGAQKCSCQNGGTCSEFGKCQCPICYKGDNCESIDVDCLVNHFKNSTLEYHANTEVSNELNVMFPILLFVILGAIYVMIRNRRMNPEVVAMPNKSYKVYVIDPTPNCHNNNINDNCDPPPPYFPPIYKSLTTREDSYCLKI